VTAMNNVNLDVGADRRDGVSNPRYSPVVPNRTERKYETNEADYMEMGVINDGFDTGRDKNEIKTNHFYQKEKVDGRSVAADDSYYLSPTDSKNGIIANPVDPQYEDVNQIAAKIRTGTVLSSSAILPKRKTNALYEPASTKKEKQLEKSHLYYGVPFWVICAIFVFGVLAIVAIICCVLTFAGPLKSEACSCTNDAGASIGKISATTGTIDTEILKQLESNITALKQEIAPQQEQIASLINSTIQNERTIQLLKEALESEKAKNRNLNNTINSLGLALKLEQASTQSINQTVNSYEARLITEERKTTEHNETLLQLRTLHDALKSATSKSSQALAANITELDRRLDEIFPTMQNFNQTKQIANLQGMLEEESLYRKGNDSILFALVNSSTMARQESVAALTADISAVKRISMQNISNLEGRLSSSINAQVTRLGTDDQILFSQVSSVNQTLRHMIQNVSLTPGPQGPTGPSGPKGADGLTGPTGPAGAGNLTGCNEILGSTLSTGTSVNAFAFYDKTTRKVVGYTCYATVPAGITFLDVANGKQCTCTLQAALGSGGSWDCKIAVFTCPKVS